MEEIKRAIIKGSIGIASAIVFTGSLIVVSLDPDEMIMNMAGICIFVIALSYIIYGLGALIDKADNKKD